MGNCIRHTCLGLLAASAFFACAMAHAQTAPVCLEITPEHPLLIFHCPPSTATDAIAYSQAVIEAWKSLPEDLRPFSALRVDAVGDDTAARDLWFREILLPLQDANVPAILRVGGPGVRTLHPAAQVDALLESYSCVKGIEAASLPFEEYCPGGAGEPLGAPPAVRWLCGVIDAAAGHGRFVSIQLDGIRWPRVMSNVSCNALYAKIAEHKANVAPVAEYRGPHSVPQISALLGLWLEGAAGQWGVAANPLWYADAHFIEPGVFGVAEQPAMPPGLYRAMIVNGVMTGATVYAFPASDDLWFGPRRYYWDRVIYKTLQAVISGGLIPRKEFVLKKTRAAYQLVPAANPADFHLNLRDIDGVLDKGFLMHGAYGMERPGQVPELILNTSRHFWVPILSPHATPDALARFAAVVQPGTQDSAQAWKELLDPLYPEPDGEGTAFITRVGRATFVMNTCENRYEEQTFRVNAPAPVRDFTAARTAEGVRLTWPFREGDLSYKVYRRIEPATEFSLLAQAPEERVFVDTTADAAQNVAYAITALTSEQEVYEGTVNFGEDLIISNVESRIDEEAMVTAMLATAQSHRIERQPTAPATVKPWWPKMEGVPRGAVEDAEAVVQQIESWDRAVAEENLPRILEIYSETYEDPQGWNIQYARRAWQWFFEHYDACAMHRQLRQWDFSKYESEKRIGVLLYCRFAGYAVSGPLGRFADLPGWFPRTDNGEVWVYFVKEDNAWRVARTNPALPNFKDILSFSASPYDGIQLGPDL